MTNLIIKLLSTIADKQPEQATVCNYSDNYYGDQVCTPKN